MDSIMTAINEYRVLLGAIVLTLITALLIKKYWEEVSFFALRIRMNIPFFGKIARLSKSTSREDSGWFTAEKELCSEFQPYFKEVDKEPHFFDDCRSYLRKASELGRKNLGALGWIAIAVMVFIEAMGFSYVLAGFTIPGASEALKQQGAVGIALLISMLLVYMTHATGHELHHNALVKKIRAWFRQSDHSEYKSMVPNNKVSLDKDSVDDHEPEWRNLLNRLPANADVTPSNKVTIATFIMVVLIAIGATYVRGQVLETEIIAEHRGDQAASTSGGSSDPYADALPPELVASQSGVDQAVNNEIMDANLKGGWATFIVLAVIFLFLQLVGVLIGFKTGFAGRESADAAKFIGKFKNREQFAMYQERKRNAVSQIAQRNLTKLQTRMAKKLADSTIDSSVLKSLEQGNGRTFLAYAKQDRESHSSYHVESTQERKTRDEQLEEAQRSERTVAAAPNAPVPTPEPLPIPESANKNHSIPEEEIQEWMAKLNWSREKTVDLLLKNHQKKEEEKKPEVSEEEALRMLQEVGQ